MHLDIPHFTPTPELKKITQEIEQREGVAQWVSLGSPEYTRYLSEHYEACLAREVYIESTPATMVLMVKWDLERTGNAEDERS